MAGSARRWFLHSLTTGYTHHFVQQNTKWSVFLQDIFAELTFFPFVFASESRGYMCCYHAGINQNCQSLCVLPQKTWKVLWCMFLVVLAIETAPPTAVLTWAKFLSLLMLRTPHPPAPPQPMTLRSRDHHVSAAFCSFCWIEMLNKRPNSLPPKVFEVTSRFIRPSASLGRPCGVTSTSSLSWRTPPPHWLTAPGWAQQRSRLP